MFENITVAINDSEISKAVLNQAIRLAGDQGARLCLLHVVDSGMQYAGNYLDPASASSARDIGDKFLQSAKATAKLRGVPCDAVLVDLLNRSIAQAIIHQAIANTADLLIVGTSPNVKGVAPFGNITESIIRLSPVPVLAIKPAHELAESQISTANYADFVIREAEAAYRQAFAITKEFGSLLPT